MNVTDAYFATVYFVDPAIICCGGRTEEEFAAQGTGDRLLLQSGSTSADLIAVPLNESEILQDVRFLLSDKLVLDWMLRIFVSEVQNMLGTALTQPELKKRV